MVDGSSSRTGAFPGGGPFVGPSVGEPALDIRHYLCHDGGKIGRLAQRLPVTPYTHFIGSLWITVAVLRIRVAAFEDCHESSKAASSVGMAAYGNLSICIS
jgi:hypothetical protein